MSGLFGTLNVANKGMNAQQVSLNTASHNISNSTTEGYSRQRVDLKADLAYTYGGIGQLGTGVKISGVTRMIDDYVTRQIRQEGSSFNQYMTKSETLEQMEIIYNEPSDTGLNFNIAEMFQSWQDLAKNPESLTSKTIVVEKSKTFADTLNQIGSQLDSLSVETENQIDKQYTDMIALAENIDTLNGQIFNVSIKGLTPNDLLDQRDKLLKDLSAITDFSAEFDKYGRVEVSIGDNNAADNILVGYDGSQGLKSMTGSDEAQILANKKAYVTSLTEESKSGALQGYKDAQDLILGEKDLSGNRQGGQLAEIRDFAGKIAAEFNKTHKIVPTNDTEDDDNGYKFFVIDETTGEISVNDILDKNNSKVLAGDNYGSAPGDNTRAKEIAGLRSKLVINGDTIEGTYNGIVTRVGISKQHSDNMAANQEVLVNQLEMRRESTSGVSLDEEFSNVIKFQKSFEANARVISVLTDMLDVLINRTGV